MLSAARPHCDAVQIRATNASPDPVSMVRKCMTLVCSQYASVPKKRSSSRRLNNLSRGYAEPNSRGRKAQPASYLPSVSTAMSGIGKRCRRDKRYPHSDQAGGLPRNALATSSLLRCAATGFLSRVICSGLFLEGPVQIFCVCISACKRCFSSSGPPAAPRWIGQPGWSLMGTLLLSQRERLSRKRSRSNGPYMALLT
jgi:hypothetical protein